MARNQKSAKFQAVPQQNQQFQQQPFQVLEGRNQNAQEAYAQYVASQAAQLGYNNANQQQLEQPQQQFANQQQFQQQPFNQQQNYQARAEHNEYEAPERQELNKYEKYQQSQQLDSRRARAQYVGNVITALFEIIAERKNANPEDSYTAYLHQEGSVALARKTITDVANSVFTLLNNEESKYAVDDVSNVVYDLFVILEAKGYDITDLCHMLEQKIVESDADVQELVDGMPNVFANHQLENQNNHQFENQNNHANNQKQKPKQKAKKPVKLAKQKAKKPVKLAKPKN